MNKRNRPKKATTMQRIECFKQYHAAYIKPKLKNGLTAFELKNFPERNQ